jgi:two-component sensor histidine kinase
LIVKFINFRRTLLCLATFASILSNERLVSKDIQDPKAIINTFRQELSSSNLQSTDTLKVYAKYIKKLVDRGNFIEADSIFNSNALGFLSIQDSLVYAGIVKDRAYMFKVQSRYDKALQDYLWLKDFFEQRKSYSALYDIYVLMAEYYRAIGNYNLCNYHLFKAKILSDQFVPDSNQLAYWYSRKAAWFNEALSNKDSVVYYANEGLKIASKSNDIYIKALLLNELGFDAMNRFENEDVVLNYFNQSIELLFQNERYRDYVDVVNNTAIYHHRKGQMNQAIRMLEEILAIEEANNWYGPMHVTYDNLAGLYRDIGNKDKFVEMREKTLLTAIKNINLNNSIKVSDLALAYEKDIAQKELQVQEEKTKIAQKEATDNKRAFIISMVITVVLLLIALISFQINLRFRRKNGLLSEQRNQIQSTNSELEKSLEQQRLLFKELNHRVKNNLSILTGLIYLQEVTEDNDKFKKTLGTLRNRIKSMALAHESLYIAEQVEKIDFQNYLNALFLELKKALSYGDKIKVEIDCQDFELDLKQAIPVAMIINELFTNSIKHGYKYIMSGVIKIKAYQTGSFSIIQYSDDGIGFGKKDAENRSLGLRLVNLLLEQLNAKFIDNSGEKGVSFVMEIPNP